VAVAVGRCVTLPDAILHVELFWIRESLSVISSFENKKSQNKLPSWDPLLRSPVSVMALLVILKVFKAGEAEVVTRCESQLAFLLLHLVWKVLHE
jgi:hypothetical protein